MPVNGVFRFMQFDRRKFFAGVREKFDKLNQRQVDGLGFLVGSFEDDPKWKDVRHIAYALATVYHETDATMRPIVEYGGVKYFDKYDTGKLAKRLGNTPEKDGDGYKYRGRGYVQITGQDNYERFGLASRPDDALKPVEAFKILSVGMQLGSFTGKKLSDFIKGSTCDYKGARKVINGTDKNILIAGYATNFEKILRSALTSASKPTTIPSEKPISQAEDQGELVAATPAPIQPEVKTVTIADQRTSVWAKIGMGFGVLTGAGVNWWGVLEAKFNALEPRHFLYVILGLGLVALALYLYDRAGKRAHERTLQLIKTAENPNTNTVVIK